jgi:alpha-glucosidase
MNSQHDAIGFDRTNPNWWKSAVFYQIYPRSFADANGDGVGDLAGITERVPYIASLGVDALWISPIFTSPMHDFGYDVADYCDIDPIFGTLADADELIARCHEHGLRITLDWVPNHTSSEHPWFAASRSSRDDNKRNWYVWRDPAPGGGPPNNWRAAFGDMPAWTFDDETGQYYLHLFLPEQPDLNWHHRPVRDAMHETLKFWLDRGVDGFRADVVHLIGKSPALPDHPRGPRSPIARIDDPATHEYLRAIRSVLDSYGHHPMMVGEVNLYKPGQVASYLGDSDELHLAFDFRAMSATWDAEKMRTTINAIQGDAASGTQPTWVLSNHDQPRHRTRYGSNERARAAAFLSLAQRSTPYLYAGEELGLGDATIPAEAVVDPGGRDGCRAPIPWSADALHGWGPEPWLPFTDDATTRSFATQDTDPDSILALYRRLLQRRSSDATLSDGAQQTLDLGANVVAWSRTFDGRRIDIAINMGTEAVEVDLQGLVLEGSMRHDVDFDGALAPDEAVMIEPR